mgnify:CR=1 FL=1|jgi:putative ABC transport system permease protein
MKFGLYPKLAFEGIKKNKRLYIPYILTCVGMIIMYYIIMFIQTDETVINLPFGGSGVIMVLEFGGWVVAFFSLLFLFYTNSFLMRRRKKEFGLYNILGMGKFNLARIIFWETVIIATVSLSIGLVIGIALAKLAELGLLNLLNADVNYTVSVSIHGVIMTLAVFGVIFLILLLNSIRQIKFSTAMSLLKSENTGEKPPKANWFWGISGAIILGVAYYIAITVENPIAAMLYFFLAVIMVIAATYILMMTGSVVFCRILQKNKRYYYKANHFVSVSSMAYRMKRNGAGLASICILATMVLVMISSTTCLYFGIESTLTARYPKDINFDLRCADIDYFYGSAPDEAKEAISQKVSDFGGEITDSYAYRNVSFEGGITGDTVDISRYFNSIAPSEISSMVIMEFVPLEDYNTIMGTRETLEPGEAFVIPYRTEFSEDELKINDYVRFKVKKVSNDFIYSASAAMDAMPTIIVIVPDMRESLSVFENMADYRGAQLMSMKWTYNFDTSVVKEKQAELNRDIRNNIGDETFSGNEMIRIQSESREANRDDYYSLFGGLFYIAIILSIVFIIAAVLIIYYKQISEGYEDRARFDIMQKVGMTKREIKRSINSQLLTVFFMPLAAAGLHLAFAFPMIKRILMLFNLNNPMLFAMTTIISFAAFAVAYTIVYKITSNAYYGIVSGIKE